MKKILISLILILLILIVTVIIAGMLGKPKDSLVNLRIKDHVFKVEVADTIEERQLGLSKRYSIAEDGGMLFVYDEKGTYGYWMKDMYFPIDILWIEDNIVVDILKSVVIPSTEKDLVVYYPYKPINKVLEIKSGLSDILNIQIGDKITISD